MQAEQDIVDVMMTRINGMPPKERELAFQLATETTLQRKFISTPGPQLRAELSDADILLFGGEGGGGKTGFGVGMALTNHDRSLIMRRTGKELSFVISEAIKFNGTKNGFNGTPGQQRLDTQDGRLIEFGSAQYLGDELSRRGIPHDYLYVDEAGEFLGQQIRNLIGWVRTSKEGQRCRVVLGSNPPTSSDGDWMVKMFAPWLDPQHPNPAAQGELRWFIMDDEDDIEVEGPGTYEYKGQDLKAMSRTFIRSRLADNPYLRDTDYGARLDMMPEPMRSAVRDGNFMIARRDAMFQIIPTAWVLAAQKRWTETPPEGVPMCAIAADIAQGGDDSTTLSSRFDGWFAKLLKFPGTATPTGNEIAGLVCANRRDEATIILDMGGGYGGAAYLRLCDNGLEDQIVCYKGAGKTMKRTADGKLKFSSTRMAAYWKLREALDPAQPNGSPISLPPGHKLVSQLTAVRFKEGPQGIMPAADSTKEAITERLGESPDEADAVVMCWFGGNTSANFQGGFQTNRTSKPLTVNVGHAAQRRNH